ncbi:MAG: ATP synthase subunit I [Deltaproteobacteria bacterium]|jgi:hypothetical protein
MALVEITENNIFALLTKGSWILLSLLTITGALSGSIRFASGVLAGGLLAMANSYWLYSVLRRALQLPARNAVLFTQVRYFVRMGLLGAAVSALIVYCDIDVIGLLLGLSVFVLNIIALTVYMSTQKGG